MRTCLSLLIYIICVIVESLLILKTIQQSKDHLLLIIAKPLHEFLEFLPRISPSKPLNEFPPQNHSTKIFPPRISSSKPLSGKKTQSDFHNVNPLTFTSDFDKFCLDECVKRIDVQRAEFNWPRHNQQPKPPEGTSVLTLKRPEDDDTHALKVWNSTFANIGTRAGLFWQKGFIIK
jgi:hypothetical protein